MLLNLDTPLLTPAIFPDLTLVDPRKKGKAYIAQYGRAFISAYRQSQSRDFYHGRTTGRYKKAELYANGEQAVKALLKDENGQPDVAGQKADLMRPLKLLKKSLRAVDGKLKDHDFTATVTPIDATAQDEKRAYEAAMRVQMEHGAFLKTLGIPPPGGASGPEVPVDEDELDLHMAVKYRHRDAMLLEMKLALALYLADYTQVNRHCLRDETTYGSSVVYLALRGPRRLPVRLHPGNCFFLPSETEDYANLQGGAHLERISLAQMLKEVDADPDTTLTITERDQLESMARSNMPGTGSGYGYYYDNALGVRPEMAGQLDVVRFSFKTQDEIVLKTSTNKFGNPQVREKPAGYVDQGLGSPGKVVRQTVAAWYEGSLVVGTDIAYGCRRAYEQMRDEDNPFDCHPLYVVTSPDLLGGFTESTVEQCYTLVDTACEAFTRLRFKLATMIGSWMEFDIDAIEAGALKKNNGQGAQMSAQETIAHFFRNGYIAARKGSPDEPGGRVGKIVEAGSLPFAEEITTHWNTIAQCRQEIEAITGINGSISAEDPASRQGAGVTQMAIAGAENTLEYLYFAKQRRFERVVRALAVSLKQSEARAPLTGPVPPGFDGGGQDVVGSSVTLSSRVMQCVIERVPTNIEWNDFYDSAKVALTQKEITLSDYSFLRQITNLKQATAMLGIRAKRNVMQAAEQAQQQTSMASQQQQESARVSGEEARKTMAQQFEQKMELEKLKGEIALAVAETQKSGQFDAAQLTAYVKQLAQQSAQQHQAGMAQQSQEVQLAQHDATLSSNEAESAAQRQHEAQQAQMAPAAGQ